MTGSFGTRRRARECALQVLYSLDVGGTLVPGVSAPEPPGHEVEQALANFWRGFQGDGERDASVVSFAEALVRGTVENIKEIDRFVQNVSRNWRMERMARVDRNILRLATYELLHVPEVPAKVVINEAIEVAKRFGASESPSFINGILDRISQEVVRP
ncbi:MAG: transcription antitermination factor NusB [Deltaproteobacteria bacterium]|nr:transcription antitermination factor NusB [Deltaproteobacteria bacterium]